VKRFPVLPTIIVAAAVAVMIGLGVWQLQRAGWKDRMLEGLAAAEAQPPVELDPSLGGNDVPPDIAFRRAQVTCTVRDAAPELRAGRSVAGASGYSAFVPCRPGAPGWAGRLQVNAGWVGRPDSALRITLPGIVAGRVGTAEPDGPIVLTAADPAASLQPSAPPRVEDIPNNHLMYAGQWFFFAATAALIYVIALRRRRRR
jgi:cytochrome oxidase assembly protein ShyY1